MAVEAGQIARGTVVHLMPYGALVRLDDGTTGLVHISEIDQNFVHNVADHVQKGDTVVVKVLSAGEKGKTELSIKQAKGQELTFTPPAVGGENEMEVAWQALRTRRKLPRPRPSRDARRAPTSRRKCATSSPSAPSVWAMCAATPTANSVANRDEWRIGKNGLHFSILH